MKPNFQKDIDNVFFKEMAERINLSGIPLDAVVTQNKFTGKLGGKANYEHDEDILEKELKTVSVKRKDLPVIPEVGDEVTLNGKKHTVKKVFNAKGKTTLYLEDYED